jgi:hypothetical protein
MIIIRRKLLASPPRGAFFGLAYSHVSHAFYWTKRAIWRLTPSAVAR